MALETVDKIRITSFIRKHPGNDIYVSDLFEGAKSKKYTELEVLEYLIDFVNARLAEKSKEEITYNYLEKLIHVINVLFYLLVDNKAKLPCELFDKITNIKNNFIKKAYSQETASNLEKILNNFLESLENQKKDAPVQIEPSNLEQRIAQLNVIIEEKDKQIKELESLLKVAQKDSDKSLKKIKEKTVNLERKKEELEELNNTITSLKNDLKALQEKCNALENEKQYVKHLQDEIAHLNKTIKNLEQDIINFQDKEKQAIIDRKQEEERQQKYIEEKQKEEERIEACLFNLLCENTLTIDAIKKQLNKEQINLSNDEIKMFLQRIQERVNIINQVRTIPMQYGVCSPKYDSNLKASIDVVTHSYNVLLVADMHLHELDTDTLYWLDELYNYASQNDINSIINLGDFVDVYTNGRKSAKNIEKIEALLEEIALKFPQSDNLNHILLGGNHDMNSFCNGIDPIKKICNMREDFVYLGYNVGDIYLNKFPIPKAEPTSNVNNILLHHPNFRADSNILDDDNINIVNLYLKNVYESNELNKKNTYIDILGHFHKSSLDIANGICVVPSFFYDRVHNGAWHVKIFFNRERKIDHIVFIPLICNQKLTPTSEISYKKTLKQ